VRRKSRLFALAEALRARRTGVTAEALADRFGVTVRTMYRDLAALQDAGLPLRADRGRGGGYALDHSYQLPPINLSAREAALLVVLGRMAIEQRLVPFSDTLEAALDKVRAALTRSAQRELLTLLAELQVVGVPALPAPPAVRRAVETAWFEGRALRMVYRKANGLDSARTIKIRNLVFDRSLTLLNCIDLDSGQDRQFRLDRIKSATLVESV
jgi:predicted DNA-binding transcriptional regulator YafY